MRYGSVCSGVEAASLAWAPLGWECKFVAEVEPFPCAVLQERFGATAPIHPLAPEDASNEEDRKMRMAWKKQNETLKTEGAIPNEGDFTKIGKKYAGKIDLLVGGTPCQDLSVAGKRAGFEGERSSLALDFVRLAYYSECKWFVWENVPGVFSSNSGRDFATLLSLFTGSKVEVPPDGWGTAGFVCNARRDRYGVAWRCLDGQFTRTSGFPFAVPQRRRRVFVVGYFGDWVRAAQVLLEPGRSKWNTPARFRSREKVTGIVGENPALASGALHGIDGGDTGNLSSTFWNGNDYAEALTCSSDRQLMPDKARLQCVIETVSGASFEINYGCPIEKELAHTLKVGTAPGTYNGVVQTLKIRSGKEGGGKGALVQDNISATLGCGNDQTLFVVHGAQKTESKDKDVSIPGVISCNSKKMGLDIGDNLCGTLNATDYKEPQIVCYENHPNDSRVTEMGDCCQTISSRAGTGGGNLPLVQECYAIDSKSSNSMKSANPHSGFHKEEVAKTLDTTIPNPTKNQGGNVICEAVAIAENIIGRKVENGGNGIGAQDELAYTQNASGVMGVCTKGVSSTVRRLLPIECERLMGFPDNHTRIPWKGKPAEECPDAPRYKACGNSMCVNVMRWIGEQIDNVDKMEQSDEY